mmetsp:Transcript_53516/g.61405  ORF Transcript_53516/g.61405 Transcript_53516/m.61405 type:complete len:150 (+) Transcript_53516:29-478(+)
MVSVVSSTHQFESTVVKAPLGKVWEGFRELRFETLFPSTVTKTEFTEGKAGLLESVVKITYKDGSTWSYRINELSDLNHHIAFELVEAEPKATVTSIHHHIKLLRVTDDNSTYIRWETDFSNDADANVIQDSKFKKVDYFKDLKKTFSC